MRKSMFASLALAFIVVGPGWAHHNMSVAFDNNKRFTQTGTLTELDWRNPHIHLSVEVKSEEGQVETWVFEGPNPGTYAPTLNPAERDIGKSDFEASLGKTVTVEASRARDGSLSGLIRQITLADGTVIALCPQYC